MAPITPTTFLISPLPASAVLEANLWFTLTRPSHCPPSHYTPFPSPLFTVPPKWPASLNSLGTWHFLPAPTDLLISHFDRALFLLWVITAHFIIKLKQPTSKHKISIHKFLIKHLPTPPHPQHTCTHADTQTQAYFAVFLTFVILLSFGICTDSCFLSYWYYCTVVVLSFKSFPPPPPLMCILEYIVVTILL